MKVEADAWSQRLRSIVAKTDRTGFTDLTLDLPTHLTDSLEVAKIIWRSFLPENVRRFLSDDLGGEGAALAVVAFCAGAHDIGKASTPFLSSLPPVATSALIAAGLRIVPLKMPIPHGTVGQVAVRNWMRERGYAKKGRGGSDLAEIIGGHHGSSPTAMDIANARRSLLQDDPAWEAARFEILDRIAAISGISEHLPGLVARGIPLSARILIEGIVILSDWIASNIELFPFLDDRSSRERARDAWVELAFPPPWVPSQGKPPDVLFSQRFPRLAGIHPNEMQRACVELAAEASEPCLLIVEAQPGSGKTEAGLMAAEVLAGKFGLGGVFIGLPTMATSNPMFDRVVDWAGTMDGSNSINLAHSKSSLHEGFASLSRESRIARIHDPGGDARVEVASWLRGRKRQLFSNIVVGTVDQFLMAGLSAKHVVLRHLALAGKVVVIDEVHAADEFMREYALMVIQWMGRYGVPVVLMSATLPPDQRQQYLDAYAGGERVDPPADTHVAYPCITRLSEGKIEMVLPEPEDGHTIDVVAVADGTTSLKDLLREQLREGGCAGVIRNTVRGAQEAYTDLKREFGDDVVLLHSRFVSPQRLKREADVVQALGRGGDRPGRLIVVGTQVLEQSLDVDFDVLITDIAPMDLLLQRGGRLHRHVRDDRPRPLKTPRMFVTGVGWDSVPPTFERGSKIIYGKAKLLRSAAALRDVMEGAGIAVPADVPSLVGQCYSISMQCPEGWQAEWEIAEQREGDRRCEARRRARDFCVQTPLEQIAMHEWLGALGEDPESPRAMSRARVRDGADTFEVIALQRREDSLLRLLGTDVVIPEGALPLTDVRLAMRMAAHTLSLPQELCVGEAGDKVLGALECQPGVPYELWQDMHWTRGQLALLFDSTGYVELPGFDCWYSDSLGFSTKRKE